MLKLLYYFLSFCFIFISFGVIGQNGPDKRQNLDSDYVCLRDYKAPPAVINNISGIFNASTKSFNYENDKIRKKVVDYLNDLHDDIIDMINDSSLMQRDIFSCYLNQIKDSIISSNPSLAGKDYTIFCFRSDVPNAYSTGNGLIVVSLSLLENLKSEAELAFIICHEIGHDLQKHVLKGMITEAKLYYDKSLKKDVKHLKNETYNTSQVADNIARKYLSMITSFSRQYELTADSLAFFLFSKAGYPKNEAVATMNWLDSIDGFTYGKQIDFKKYFNFSDYPFNNEWLNFENAADSLGGNLKSVYELPDSLKSHPDCPYRSKLLSQLINSSGSGPNSNNIKSYGDFIYYSQASRFEMVEYYMGEMQYGRALYNALCLLNDYPNNIYLNSIVVNCLYEIHEAMKRHEFSWVVDFPNNYYPNPYNYFLKFLQELNSSALSEITSHFFKERVENNTATNDYAGYVGLLEGSMDKAKPDYTSMLTEYEKNHSDPYYKTILINKLNKSKTKK